MQELWEHSFVASNLSGPESPVLADFLRHQNLYQYSPTISNWIFAVGNLFYLRTIDTLVAIELYRELTQCVPIQKSDQLKFAVGCIYLANSLTRGYFDLQHIQDATLEKVSIADVFEVLPILLKLDVKFVVGNSGLLQILERIESPNESFDTIVYLAGAQYQSYSKEQIEAVYLAFEDPTSMSDETRKLLEKSDECVRDPKVIKKLQEVLV